MTSKYNKNSYKIKSKIRFPSCNCNLCSGPIWKCAPLMTEWGKTYILLCVYFSFPNVYYICEFGRFKFEDSIMIITRNAHLKWTVKWKHTKSIAIVFALTNERTTDRPRRVSSMQLYIFHIWIGTKNANHLREAINLSDIFAASLLLILHLYDSKQPTHIFVYSFNITATIGYWSLGSKYKQISLYLRNQIKRKRANRKIHQIFSDIFP